MEKNINVIAQSQCLSSELHEEFSPQPVVNYQFVLSSTGGLINPNLLVCDTDEFTVGDLLSSKEGKEKFVVMDIDTGSALITLEYAKNAYVKILFLLVLLIGCWFPVSYIFERIFS
ncbi:hypothetical protein [Halodesulfovibrio marinisediminis]|uniref:Uncharacterized protein n=1 Tax=Halodesulfovibrio marinisediminis DSM 17456 TaxID=1121457 RepID=A0A1N6DXG2_9BACT|nr:hypothetical protein [Halodesulfovibrio marinisediminis]SIN75432.1 hypothetical protein SAMN02745161_0553 [Halodesulfovibrio marinisediminis DSM 17456]